MRLISCHIENFGKLSDKTVDFQELSGNGGPVIINEPNGTGKSTLATFIKVMFFGFANEGKRSETDNERKRCQPWQGGTYGGQLTFSTGEKVYRINRTFGSRVKDDTFTLYDAKTNLESKDYSEDIGEELLQIDQESFMRTVFISQNDCATVTTDSINAKLGNLADATDDMNNYEAVRNLLGDYLNSMSPTRKTGLLYKKKNEISEIRDRIRKGESIDATMKELTQKREMEKDKAKELEAGQEAIQKKLQEMSRVKDVAAQKELYDNLCSRCEERKTMMERQKEYFPGRIPGEAELEEWNLEAARLVSEGHSLAKLQLTEKEREEILSLETVFASGVPDKATLDDMKQKVKELSAMRLQLAKGELSEDDVERLDELTRLFRGEVPDEKRIDEKINAWNKRTEKKNLLNTKRASVDTLRTVAAKRITEEKTRNASERSNATIILVIGVALLVAGVVSLVLQKAAGVVGLIIGVGFIIYSTSWKSRIAKKERILAGNENYQIDSAEINRLLNEIRDDEQFIRQTEMDCRTFFERYELIYEEIAVSNHLNHLRNKVNEYYSLLKRKERFEARDLTRQYQELSERIEAFLGGYLPDVPANPDSYADSLHTLEKQIAAREGYQKRQEQIALAEETCETLAAQVKGYITGPLAMEPWEDVQEQLQDVRNHYFEYKTSEREYRSVLDKKAIFEKEHDMAKLQESASVSGDVSMEELNAQLKQLTDRLKVTNETIAAYAKPLDKAYADREQIAEDELMLAEAEEEYASCKHRYEVMELTRSFLEKAKESFTSRYMNPVMNGFEKYYRMVSGEEADGYRMDANMNLTVQEHGKLRDVKLLSSGYQNLTGVCMRMALLDAMYRKEKPFVIFDDPFVNLDGDKVEGGLAFLREIAKEYQVLYFTCHDSRAGNKTGAFE